MESLHDPDRGEVLADKVFRYSMPVDVLYPALTAGRSAWLRLQPGEVEPQVLKAVPSERVVWSSFWPVSPDDIIELILSPDPTRTTARMFSATGSALRVRWLSSSPPDDRGIGITRWRLSRKFGGDLRAVESEYYWGMMS
jgi:hypothetical protein